MYQYIIDLRLEQKVKNNESKEQGNNVLFYGKNMVD
jgi:hypothetical protein